MDDDKIIKKVVNLTERATNGDNVSEIEILEILNILDFIDKNLNIYKGILILYYYNKFQKFYNNRFKNILLGDERFLRCDALLRGIILTPHEIGDMFLSIITLTDEDSEYRDILLGIFYGSLWSFMNNPNNFDIAVDYGFEIAKLAFVLDDFNITKKLKLNKKGVKIVSLAGSGKKEIKLLNISSMVAVITAAVGRKINKNIIVEKTVAGATSSKTGSSDVFRSIGINFNVSINDMAKISLETKLGIFDINMIVPKLNSIYDNRLYNVQVFAGLVGGAAIVNPVDVDLINYGLTRGSSKLCLAILNKLYPDKNIIVLQGKNKKGQSIVDQISIVASTEISQIINGKNSLDIITPNKFDFDFESFKYLQAEKNPKENIEQFIKLLAGRGNQTLEQVVAMEVALNLVGLEIVDNLKVGANLALEVIHSGEGIEILENLVFCTSGDKNKFNSLLNSSLM